MHAFLIRRSGSLGYDGGDEFKETEEDLSGIKVIGSLSEILTKVSKVAS
jgi:hypothetical protein